MARRIVFDPSPDLSVGVVVELRAERVARYHRFRHVDLADRLGDGAPFLFWWRGRPYFAGPDDRPREVWESRPLRDPFDGDAGWRFVDTGEPVPRDCRWSGGQHRIRFC